MSYDNFKPTIWSRTLLLNLDKQHVYANIVNRNYEGEISKYGDSVKINQLGNVTIGDYTIDSDIGAPERLNSNQTLLTIDQQKFFNFAVDDIDKVQANIPLLDQYANRAAYGMAEVTDNFIAGLYLGATNTIGDDTTPITPDTTTVYEQFLELGLKLDEANVPKTGRFVVVPPWFTRLLRENSIFTHSTVQGDDVVNNGFIKRVNGFDIYESNNVPNTAGAKYKIIAGHPMAITFAEQLIELKPYSIERSFGDALKGLHVYGGKLVLPSALAVLTANRPSGI